MLKREYAPVEEIPDRGDEEGLRRAFVAARSASLPIICLLSRNASDAYGSSMERVEGHVSN
jgi:hypothetical protein